MEIVCVKKVGYTAVDNDHLLQGCWQQYELLHDHQANYPFRHRVQSLARPRQVVHTPERKLDFVQQLSFPVAVLQLFINSRKSISIALTTETAHLEVFGMLYELKHMNCRFLRFFDQSDE